MPAGRALSQAEITALFTSTGEDTSLAGRCDIAILALCYAAGLRRAEVSALDVENVEQTEDEGFEIKLVGKGNKERLVYLSNGAAKALGLYLTVRGDTGGALFFSGRRGGRLIIGQRITDQGVYGVLKKRASKVLPPLSLRQPLHRWHSLDELRHSDQASSCGRSKGPELRSLRVARSSHGRYGH